MMCLKPLFINNILKKSSGSNLLNSFLRSSSSAHFTSNKIITPSSLSLISNSVVSSRVSKVRTLTSLNSTSAGYLNTQSMNSSNSVLLSSSFANRISSFVSMQQQHQLQPGTCTATKIQLTNINTFGLNSVMFPMAKRFNVLGKEKKFWWLGEMKGEPLKVSLRKKKKKFGFLSRLYSPSGRKILFRRMLKGRKYLSH